MKDHCNCGWCRASIPLDSQWYESDGAILCKDCYDTLMDGTKEAFLARHKKAPG